MKDSKINITPVQKIPLQTTTKISNLSQWTSKKKDLFNKKGQRVNALKSKAMKERDSRPTKDLFHWWLSPATRQIQWAKTKINSDLRMNSRYQIAVHTGKEPLIIIARVLMKEILSTIDPLHLEWLKDQTPKIMTTKKLRKTKIF